MYIFFCTYTLPPSKAGRVFYVRLLAPVSQDLSYAAPYAFHIYIIKTMYNPIGSWKAFDGKTEVDKGNGGR